jgi:hypothetical protein
VRGNHWETTPIFYYLKAGQYHFVGKDYSTEIANHPDGRVWVLIWDNNYIPRDMSYALRSYTPGEAIDVWGARAVLYR